MRATGTDSDSQPSQMTSPTATATWLRRAVYLGPVLVYLVLVLGGITNSNIGVYWLREDPGDPEGLQIGQSQVVRSDEYTTESPIWLGEIARDGQDALNPLTVSNDFFAQLPSGPASSIVFLDGTLLSSGLPDQMLFAAKWWLPTLLLFLGLPIWFRQVTGKLRWGYLAAVLVFVAPASMWWSGRPVNTLGFVAAGCALAIFGARAIERRAWLTSVASIIVSGILLARLPTYYQPLAIVIGVPLIVATGAYLLAQSWPWRTRLIAIGAISASALIWTAAIFWESRDAIGAGLSTVYPGDRKSTGAAVDVGRLLGATNMGWLERVGVTGATFETELATPFNILFFIIVLLFVSRRWDGARTERVALISLVVFAAFWLSWSMIDWGSVGSMIPIVNRVPNFRATQGAGYVAILAFCLFMSRWRRHDRESVAVVSAASAAALSAYGGSSLQLELLPDLTTAMIWVSAAVTGVVVYLLVSRPNRWFSLVAAGAAATAMTIAVTPILFGLGDLRDSPTAQQFLGWGAESRAAGSVWASDSGYVDALMLSTATPSLSSRQQIGPNVDGWNRLDPGAEHEDMWNRGGLHIQFFWTDDADLTWTQPSPDIVRISGSPCVVAERMPELSHISSTHPLDLECGQLSDTFTWSGIEHFVYEMG